MRFADETAVDFELGFAGAAGADAGRRHSGDAFEVAPHAGEARVGVFHLRELDLELGLVGLGAGGEDVEDQLGAVEDFDAVAAGGRGFC
jgi:hypothetical protein